LRELSFCWMINDHSSISGVSYGKYNSPTRTLLNAN
jgi:hypothetical protein